MSINFGIIKTDNIKILSNDSFNLLKKSSFLALLIECLCIKDNMESNELHTRLKDIENLWNCNNNDYELIKKENKPRDVICKERIMKGLESLFRKSSNK